MNKKGTIILDFLMFVIMATVIAVSVITYMNIVEIKKGYSRELSTTVSNIVFIFEKCAGSVKVEDEESFEKMAEKIINTSNGKIYSIGINGIKSENELEELFSTVKEEHEKIKKIENIKTILSKEKEYVRQIAVDGHQIYEYIKVMEDGKIINIELSLQSAIIEFRKAFIMNVIVGICAILFMVGFTTYILLNKIYKPIAQLREEIKKIQNGDVAYQVNLGVSNELNELANEINMMKDSLWEKSFADKFSHPVTGLPGLMTEIGIVTDMIDKNKSFSIVNITIKNFEKYILRKGFVKGEDYLRNFYNMIEECIAAKGNIPHKMFQTRENSISVLAGIEDTVKLGESIVEKFDKEFSAVYENEENSTVKIKNKNGEEIDYPVTKLIITIINNDKSEITSYRDIENKILEIEKHYAGVDNKSYCILSGKEEETVENEEENIEDVFTENSSEELLDGLDKIKENKE